MMEVGVRAVACDPVPSRRPSSEMGWRSPHRMEKRCWTLVVESERVVSESELSEARIML